MIIITDDHKNRIRDLLTGYEVQKFEKVLKEIEPIFKEYYPESPLKIGKYLLNKLFETWLGKQNEAIVHY